jgi:hypothetical protein
MQRISSTVAVLILASLPLAARAQAAAKPGKSMAAVLQPFLDEHDMAGPVVLVASKDKMLDVEAVGYTDIAAAIEFGSEPTAVR